MLGPAPYLQCTESERKQPPGPAVFHFHSPEVKHQERASLLLHSESQTSHKNIFWNIHMQKQKVTTCEKAKRSSFTWVCFLHWERNSGLYVIFKGPEKTMPTQSHYILDWQQQMKVSECIFHLLYKVRLFFLLFLWLHFGWSKFSAVQREFWKMTFNIESGLQWAPVNICGVIIQCMNTWKQVCTVTYGTD